MKHLGAARSPLPLYRKLKDHILSHVRSGDWSPGSRVPSENELVAQFGISRMTANRALRELMQDGYLDRVRGLGTFVKEAPRHSSLMEIRNIADEISERGHHYESQVVELLKAKADRKLASAFGIDVGKMLYKITLVHFENGLAVQLERRHVNPAAAPFFLRQDFSKTTPTAYLLSIRPVDELEHRVLAVLPDHAARKLLHVRANEPCIELHRLSWSGDQVVTSVTLTYPGSRYELKSRYRTSPSGRVAQVSAVD